MDTRSITHTNLETGEVLSTDLKLPDTKFIQRGYKMYNYGIDYIIDNFTKSEMKRIMKLYDKHTVDYYNMLILPFNQLTPDLHPSDRSKFKRKLIDKRIIQIYNKRMMLNPFIFVPKGDKNIQNCNHLTQQVWKYMFEDVNNWSDRIELHAEHIFGADFTKPTHMTVGSSKHTKLIPTS